MEPLEGRHDLTRLRDLLESKTGIFLSHEQVGRLQEFFQNSSARPSSSGEILHAIAAGSPRGKEYLNQLVASVATNETYFFCILPHSQVLEKYVLPEIVSAKSGQPWGEDLGRKRGGKRSNLLFYSSCRGMRRASTKQLNP